MGASRTSGGGEVFRTPNKATRSLHTLYDTYSMLPAIRLLGVLLVLCKVTFHSLSLSLLQYNCDRCIKSLKLSCRNFELDQDDIFSSLGRVGPQLTSLEISNCVGMASKALATLLSGLGQKLTTLDLSECLDMGDE